MKKMLAVLMVVFMIVTMCSCGSSKDKTSEETNVSTSNVALEESDKEDSLGRQNIKVKNTYVRGEQIVVFPQASKKTLCDTSEYKMFFKGLEYTGDGLIVNLVFENKTDENLCFDKGFFFVNEWNVESAVWYTSKTLGPNESKEIGFSIPLWELEFRHIEIINTISFNFIVGGEKTELFTIETDTKEKDISFVPDGEVVYDYNGVKAVLPDGGCIDENGVCMYVENNSDKAVFVRNSLTPSGDEAFKYNGKGVILYPHTKDVYFAQMEIYEISPGSELDFNVSSTEYNLDEMSYDKFSMVYGEEYVIVVE